jgi:TorA maturation chaperone TorD
MSSNIKSDQVNILKGYNMLLYFAGSMIMYEPVEECITDFISNGIVNNLPVKSANPRFVEAASQLRQTCENLAFCKQVLIDDYNRLFANSGLLLAPPFKSCHTPEIQEHGSNSETVTEFYNAYGWKFRSRYNINDDHLGIELLFLTLLTDKYISFEDEACKVEMKSEIRRFIVQHIFSWIPAWNRKVQEKARTSCYKGIASLIYASCEDIYRLLDGRETGQDIISESKN